MAISVVGVDLSKSVFQLSIADSKHHIVDRKRLSRAQFHRFLVSLPKTPSVNSFLLYFINRSPLQASDIFEKGSVVLGAPNSRHSDSSRRTRAEHRIH
jgi:hypothetical protein